MNSQLVDPTGKVWDAGSGQLRMMFHARIDSSALPDYLVRNHGYVEVSHSQNGCLVRFAPGRLKYDCYVTTIGLIEEHCKERGSLVWYDGQWHYELILGARALTKRFLALKLGHAEKRLDRYMMMPRAIDHVGRFQQHANLLDYWRAESGRIDIARCREQIRSITDGKYLSVRRNDATGTLQFREIGKGLATYHDDNWKDNFQDKPVEIQPDMRYGAWIANTFRQALVVGEPELSEVEAIVAADKDGALVHQLLFALGITDGE